jgi:hypothetical protein
VRPTGGTLIGICLHAILRPYLRELEAEGEEKVKHLNIIVITDGRAIGDVESVIVSAARRRDKCYATAWQVGIQLLRVGDDEEAAKMLKHLNDHLGQNSGPNSGKTSGKAEAEGPVREIVDTVSLNGKTSSGLDAEGVLKCVLGAVHRNIIIERTSDGRH